MALVSLVTIVGWRAPELLGSGQGFVDNLLENKGVTLPAATPFFVIRFVSTPVPAPVPSAESSYRSSYWAASSVLA